MTLQTYVESVILPAKFLLSLMKGDTKTMSGVIGLLGAQNAKSV